MKEVADVIKERFAHPIFGTYIVSLSILNWRMWLMLLSGDETYYSRIQALEVYFSENKFLLSFAYALGMSVFYLYVLPFIVELFLWGYREIIVYRENKERKFKFRLANEEKLGGEAEILATFLKRDLIAFSQHSLSLTRFIEKIIPRGNVGIMKEFGIIQRQTEYLEKEMSEISEYTADILTQGSRENLKTSEIAKRFYEKRKFKS